MQFGCICDVTTRFKINCEARWKNGVYDLDGMHACDKVGNKGFFLGRTFVLKECMVLVVQHWICFSYKMTKRISASNPLSM